MVAARVAALSNSHQVRVARGIASSVSGRGIRAVRATPPSLRLQIVGAVVGGILAGFAVAALVRRLGRGSQARTVELLAAAAREPDVEGDREEEPTYAFEPEAILDLPEELRPPVSRGPEPPAEAEAPPEPALVGAR